MFRGPHWTLLAFVNSADILPLENFTYDAIHLHVILPSHAEGVENIIDKAGNAYRIYDVVSDELILIRPDGYIALRTSIQDSPEIFEYFKSRLTLELIEHDSYS